MASRDNFDVDMFHKSIQYALEKLGKSKSVSGFERTVVSKFKRKRRVGSGNELVDYSRAPCLGADQKTRGLWERDWAAMLNASSETQGQLVGAGKSLKTGEKKFGRRTGGLFFARIFFRPFLVFSPPPLTAPGSPRMC